MNPAVATLEPPPHPSSRRIIRASALNGRRIALLSSLPLSMPSATPLTKLHGFASAQVLRLSECWLLVPRVVMGRETFGNAEVRSQNGEVKGNGSLLNSDLRKPTRIEIRPDTTGSRLPSSDLLLLKHQHATPPRRDRNCDYLLS